MYGPRPDSLSPAAVRFERYGLGWRGRAGEGRVRTKNDPGARFFGAILPQRLLIVQIDPAAGPSGGDVAPNRADLRRKCVPVPEGDDRQKLAI